MNTTYPGVYIQEVKSSVRTITGVPTSIAAFVGGAPRGPVDEPVRITSWADYETYFGGLDQGSPMSYAVYQFYQNGGSEAEIVRLVGTGGAKATLPLGDGGASGGAQDPRRVVQAISPGAWGNNLRARVETPKGAPEVFNLTILDTETGTEEQYLNVSTVDGDPRSLDNLLKSSRLVTVVPATKDTPGPPTANGDPPPNTAPLGDQPKGDKPPPKDSKPWFTQAQHGQDSTGPLTASNYTGDAADKTGIQALRKADIFNLLCLPSAGNLPSGVLDEAAKFCEDRRAVLLVDPQSDWTAGEGGALPRISDLAKKDLPVLGEPARNAAFYFPRVVLPDPLLNGAERPFPPCGVMAGVIARTDVQRGVWKAPAGTDASLNGVRGLEVPMSDGENGILNPLGVNCLRQFPAVGPVAWGARTLRGADQLADEWKYLPVRRLALFIEESLYRGTQWVVFEPNDEPLWASIRLNIGAFMNSLFREGAFQGRTPAEAYLVKCDRENNPQNDIDRGIVHIHVGFAPLKPAEFVIIDIQQLAGQVQV
ncbi:phage tail sheath family protein [Streptomyces sp. XH2]|uniref:phage tail sheath family protein n=1 Tax=Streptomyces sp. XH2 TaxID=3412483 RepID=UPI003C7C9E2A